MVRRMRQRQGVSQAALAKKARISQAYLSRLESGAQKNPSVAVLQRLAKALGVPVTGAAGVIRREGGDHPMARLRHVRTFSAYSDGFEHEIYDYSVADFEKDRETLRKLRMRETQR